MSASVPQSFQAAAPPPIPIDTALSVLNSFKANQRRQQALDLENTKLQLIAKQAGQEITPEGTVQSLPPGVLAAEATARAGARVKGQEVLSAAQASQRGEALRALQAITSRTAAPAVPPPTPGPLSGVRGALERETRIPAQGEAPVLGTVRNASILSTFFDLPPEQQQAALADPGIAAFLQGEAVEPGGRQRTQRLQEAQAKTAEQRVSLNEAAIQLSNMKAEVMGKVQRGEALAPSDFAIISDSPAALIQNLPEGSPLRVEAQLRLDNLRKSNELLEAQIGQIRKKSTRKGRGDLFSARGTQQFTTVGQLLKDSIEQAEIDLTNLDDDAPLFGGRSYMARLSDVVRHVKRRAVQLEIPENFVKIVLEETIKKQVKAGMEEIGPIEERLGGISTFADFSGFTPKQQIKLIGEGILNEIEILDLPK